jgi:hypothetical protein
MPSNPEIVFIPSFTTRIEDYPQLSGHLGSAATLHGIAIDWRDQDATLADRAQFVAEQVNGLGVSHDAFLIGHSLGAILAAQEAKRRQYGGLMLCSMSPWGPSLGTCIAEVKERLGDEYATWLAANPRSIWEQEQHTITTPQIIDRIQVPSSRCEVLVGSLEVSGVIDHARNMAEHIKCKAVIVPEADHFIESFPSYIDAVKASAVRLYS